jgi:nitroreductase
MNSESFNEVVFGRRSIRKFSSKPLGRDVIEKLIDAAAWAPSAGNRQDWFFTVVTSQKVKAEMVKAVNVRWKEIIESNKTLGVIEEIEKYSASFADFADAPAVFVVSAATVNAVQKHLLGEDAFVTGGSATSAAMAAENLMLQAHSLGLGSCCMTGALAARKQLAEIVGLNKKREIICLITVGYPAESPAAPARKSVDEIARIIE